MTNNPAAYHNGWSTEQKKQIATGSDRDAAICILAPRILGAIEQHAALRPTKSGPWLTWALSKKRFRMELVAQKSELSLCVLWRRKRVFAGAIEFGDRGRYFDGRLRVTTWKRKGSDRSWQEDLFDVFTHDSDRLFKVPAEQLIDELAKFLKLPGPTIEQIFANGVLDQPGAFANSGFFEVCNACEEAAREGIPVDQIAVAVLEIGVALLSVNHPLPDVSRAVRQWARKLTTGLRPDLVSMVYQRQPAEWAASLIELPNLPVPDSSSYPASMEQAVAVWKIKQESQEVTNMKTKSQLETSDFVPATGNTEEDH